LLLAGLSLGLLTCVEANPAYETWDEWECYCYPDGCVAVLREELDVMIKTRLLMCDQTGCYCMGGGAGAKHKCCDGLPLSEEGIRTAYLEGCCW